MTRKRLIFFLLLSVAFATTHYFAVLASLYWYYSWFDIVMHFWGGGLIALGVHSLSTFSFVHCRPDYKIILGVLILITGTWEIFEWFVGLYEPATYLLDTAKDVIVGFSGGLLAHTILRRYTID
jgi:hypothetical protein